MHYLIHKKGDNENVVKLINEIDRKLKNVIDKLNLFVSNLKNTNKKTSKLVDEKVNNLDVSNL